MNEKIKSKRQVVIEFFEKNRGDVFMLVDVVEKTGLGEKNVSPILSDLAKFDMLDTQQIDNSERRKENPRLPKTITGYSMRALGGAKPLSVDPVNIPPRQRAATGHTVNVQHVVDRHEQQQAGVIHTIDSAIARPMQSNTGTGDVEQCPSVAADRPEQHEMTVAIKETPTAFSGQMNEMVERQKMKIENERLREIVDCARKCLEIAGIPEGPSIFDRLRTLSKMARANVELQSELEILRRARDDMASEIERLSAENMLLKNQLQNDEIDCNSKFYVFDSGEIGGSVKFFENEDFAIAEAGQTASEFANDVIVCRHHGRVEMSPRFVRG